MKKTIVSILLLAGLVSPAVAKMKSTSSRTGHIPYMQNPVIDHSKDVAYSARWAHRAKSPAPDAHFVMGYYDNAMPAGLPGKTYFYSYGLNGFTLYGRYAQVRMNAPYMGMDAPSWDGPEKNNYRNMRAYNESERLPSNSGR